MSVHVWCFLWVLGAVVFALWHAIITAPKDTDDPGFPDL